MTTATQLNPSKCQASRILVADDQPAVQEALRLLLKGAGYVPETVNSPFALLAAMERGKYDLVLMDMNYSRDTTSGTEGMDLLHRLQATGQHPPVIVMTAWSDVDLAVEAMRSGARDFVQKPWDNARLLSTIGRNLAASAPNSLSIARGVQQKLLPQKKKVLQTLQYGGECYPASEVGGDYYDFIDLDRHRAGFVIADVSGKGVAAALLMANLQALIRSQPELGDLESVNQLFFDSTSPEHYATLFYGHYDDGTRSLTYANCGHHAPILVRQSGAIEFLDATSTVLGLFRNWKCGLATVQLSPGDTLVLYSDGVVEAGLENGEEFGKDRLAAIIQATRYQKVETALCRIMEAVHHYSPGEQADDVTVVAMRAV